MIQEQTNGLPKSAVSSLVATREAIERAIHSEAVAPYLVTIANAIGSQEHYNEFLSKITDAVLGVVREAGDDREPTDNPWHKSVGVDPEPKWEVAGGGCICLVNPKPFTHYGAIEPGDALDPNPDCPLHFPIPTLITNTEREALGSIIWHTSRADEGTISATGANIVADAILAAGYSLTTEQREKDAEIAESHRPEVGTHINVSEYRMLMLPNVTVKIANPANFLLGVSSE